MAITTLNLITKRSEGGNVWSFEFRSSRPLSWIAGQAIRVDLPHPEPDAKGTNRYFTIAAAPHEQIIRITTRLTDSTFKQALAGLQPGDPLILTEAPAGGLTWPTSTPTATRLLVLAAQGIGITPFYSMLLDRVHHRLPLTATLVHANLTGHIPFESTLLDWANTHPELTLHYLSEPITATKLSQLIPDLAASQVYISGPKALTQLLAPPHNLSPSQLKTDQFPNYSSHQY